MNTKLADTTVRKSIVVNASAERAFSVFTTKIASWWPAEHHVIKVPLAEMVFEPRAGGRIYDRGVDGSECQWGTVIAHEPPQRVVFSWNLSPQWETETDVARTSEVEVRFIAESSDRTRVELEHRHLDRHGVGWEGMRDAVGSDEGWRLTLQSYARQIHA